MENLLAKRRDSTGAWFRRRKGILGAPAGSVNDVGRNNFQVVVDLLDAGKAVDEALGNLLQIITWHATAQYKDSLPQVDGDAAQFYVGRSAQSSFRSFNSRLAWGDVIRPTGRGTHPCFPVNHRKPPRFAHGEPAIKVRCFQVGAAL